MYELAEKKLQLGQFATKFQLEQRMGKTLRIVRYKRLNLPTSTLSEGTPPDAVALATENVDVIVEQWGIVVLLTDVSQITTKHPALNIATERTSLAMAEVLEREMAVTLLGGTNVFYGGDATSRASLDGDKLTTANILAVLANLRANGAGDWEGGLYGGVMPPQVEADIIGADQTFQNANSYAGNLRPLEFGEIGVWMGVRWVRGQFLPILHGVAAPDANNPTAEKTEVDVVATGGSWGANDVANIIVVAREITTGYERKVSQASADLTLVNTTDKLVVHTPTSTAYVYDIYCTKSDDADPAVLSNYDRVHTGVAANTEVNILGFPTGSVTPPVIPASGKTVFFVFVFGKDYFGRVELNGMSLESYITPAGASYSNPLAQGRKIGCKIMWKSFLIDNAYGARIECNSAYSGNLPA